MARPPAKPIGGVLERLAAAKAKQEADARALREREVAALESIAASLVTLASPPPTVDQAAAASRRKFGKHRRGGEHR